MQKIFKRYLSQKLVEQQDIIGKIVSWWDCVVEYTDGTQEVVREISYENADKPSHQDGPADKS